MLLNEMRTLNLRYFGGFSLAIRTSLYWGQMFLSVDADSILKHQLELIRADIDVSQERLLLLEQLKENLQNETSDAAEILLQPLSIDLDELLSGDASDLPTEIPEDHLFLKARFTESSGRDWVSFHGDNDRESRQFRLVTSPSTNSKASLPSHFIVSYSGVDDSAKIFTLEGEELFRHDIGCKKPTHLRARMDLALGEDSNPINHETFNFQVIYESASNVENALLCNIGVKISPTRLSEEELISRRKAGVSVYLNVLPFTVSVSRTTNFPLRYVPEKIVVTKDKYLITDPSGGFHALLRNGTEVETNSEVGMQYRLSGYIVVL